MDEARAESQSPRTVKLGRSDISVTEVCLGTMTFGSMSNEQTAVAILDRYVELGGNFIDTAEMYPVPTRPDWAGESERIVGRWLTARPDLRGKLVIATKVSGPSASGDSAKCVGHREKTLIGTMLEDAPPCDFSETQIRRACAASLKRLQIDQIDLYQIHWPERKVPLCGANQHKAGFVADDAANDQLQGHENVVATIGALIKEGKIRAWGLSNETSFGVCTIAGVCDRLGVPHPITIQNDFSLCARTFESELAESCRRDNHNLSLIAYGVLNGGALSGKYLENNAAPDARFNFVAKLGSPTFQGRYHGNRTNLAIAEYTALAKAAGMSTATLAQAWAYSRYYLGAVIIGATSLEQLESNWAAAGTQLSDELLEKIDDVHRKYRNPNLTD